MEYILIENYVHTSVEFYGVIYRPDSVYVFKNSKGAVYDGYYPPKIDSYIDKHLSFSTNVTAPVEGEWIIEDKSIFDAFYNDLKADPDIQVDFKTIQTNSKY